jgi:hypothetical protein
MYKLEPTERAYLRQFLVDCFSLEELKNLSFDLGVDPEKLGQSKADLCRELIVYFEHEGTIRRLVEEILRQQEDAELRDLLETLPQPEAQHKIELFLHGYQTRLDLEKVEAELAKQIGVRPEEVEIVTAPDEPCNKPLATPTTPPPSTVTTG